MPFTSGLKRRCFNVIAAPLSSSALTGTQSAGDIFCVMSPHTHKKVNS